MRRARLIALLLLGGLLAGAGFLFCAEHLLAAPMRAVIGPPPPDLRAETVEIPPEPKQLWLVPGTAHVDLDRFAGAEYERRVLEFLAGAFRAGKAGVAQPQASPA